MRRYTGDPYWVTLREGGTCAGCREAIAKGGRAFRYKTGHTYGQICGCGDQAERDFRTQSEMETYA